MTVISRDCMKSGGWQAILDSMRAAPLFRIAPLLIHLWRHLQLNDVKTYVSTSGSLRRLPGLS
jgi:hypothetical protein